jgi:hypothetical protein
VAGQLGKAYDEVTYLGEPGLCPMCHLSVIELAGTEVTCATCGCRGILRIGSAAAPGTVGDSGAAIAGAGDAGAGDAGAGDAGAGDAGAGDAGAGDASAGDASAGDASAGDASAGAGDVIEWTDRATSVLSMAEKRAHAAEIQETAGRHRELQSTIAERAATIPVFAPVTPR